VTDPRTPVFDAIKAARKGRGYNQSEVEAVHDFLDRLTVPRAEPVKAPAAAPASSAAAIPDDYWPMLSRIESGDRPFVKAATSSASGLYQFIKSTWEGEGGRWGSNMALAFGGLKPSVEEQLQRARTFTEKNAAVLRKQGIPVNKASLYAAHFFGAGTAAKVLKAELGARADVLAGAAATNANPSILRNKTVGQFLSWLHRKTGEWAK
jgi:hypothetical protein